MVQYRSAKLRVVKNGLYAEVSAVIMELLVSRGNSALMMDVFHMRPREEDFVTDMQVITTIRRSEYLCIPLWEENIKLLASQRKARANQFSALWVLRNIVQAITHWLLLRLGLRNWDFFRLQSL